MHQIVLLTGAVAALAAGVLNVFFPQLGIRSAAWISSILNGHIKPPSLVACRVAGAAALLWAAVLLAAAVAFW